MKGSGWGGGGRGGEGMARGGEGIREDWHQQHSFILIDEQCASNRVVQPHKLMISVCLNHRTSHATWRCCTSDGYKITSTDCPSESTSFFTNRFFANCFCASAKTDIFLQKLMGRHVIAHLQYGTYMACITPYTVRIWPV